MPERTSFFMVWFWVRIYYLPVPALMLEPVGVFGAIARGFALTRRQFWRTFGIRLLAWGMIWIATMLVSVPVTLLVGWKTDGARPVLRTWPLSV